LVELQREGFSNSASESGSAKMTISGHVENGQIVLDEPVPLADGMKVRVELLPANSERPSEDEQMPTLYERHKSFIGIIDDLPSDFARNHDHYLHGQPKK
jgi:hypothetical protein